MYEWDLIPGVGSPAYWARAQTIRYDHYTEGALAGGGAFLSRSCVCEQSACESMRVVEVSCALGSADWWVTDEMPSGCTQRVGSGAETRPARERTLRREAPRSASKLIPGD